MTADRSLKVLVTGAGGMLAHDLVPALEAAGHSVTAANRADLDITDPGACAVAVAGHDLVVNTAAWTAVDDAESNEPVAFAINAVGAANVARAAAAAEAPLLHVSTDYVFDGQATKPYAADSPVCPRSAYGRTKAAGEWAVRALCPQSWVVRTAWLYGAGGPNFVETMTRLAHERDTVSVVDDQVGQPTWTVDLADLIVRLVGSSAPYGIYHGTSQGQVSWFGFTRAIFEKLGLDPERVQPTTTEAFPRPAPRPAWSVLSHDTLVDAGLAPIQDWRRAIGAYLSTPDASSV